MDLFELFKVILFGIVEGYTEWLPISSTGHLILLENIIHLNQPEEFWNVFKVVIQLGAILAVVLLYWDKLWPFSKKKNNRQKADTWSMWIKVIAACIPAVIVGLPLDDILDKYLSVPIVIAAALVGYGIIFIVLERINKHRKFTIKNMHALSLKTAVMIGGFQCLSLIPGTSRSGATILGAMILGCSRPVAAEFSFFLGIPVMFGASFLKIVKHGLGFTGEQVFILIFGMLVSFLVSVFAIRFLMKYIKKHDFTVFGWYRIVLGILVFIWFTVPAH